MAIGWPAFRLARRSAAALACPVACKLVCALACTLAGGCTRPTQDVRIGYACLAPDGGGQDAAAPGGATPGLASVGRGLAPAGDAAGPIAAAADRAGPVSTAHDAAGRDAAADRDQARDAASDARSDGTARACAAYGPLRCVNFLHFKVTDGREERGSCVETREVIGGGIGTSVSCSTHR